MLGGKPYLMYKDHQKIKGQGYEHIDGGDGGDSENGDAQMQQTGHEGDDFDFGDIMINQIIHTIECVRVSRARSHRRFCLGARTSGALHWLIAQAPSATRPRTCGSGRCRWRTLRCVRLRSARR